MHRCRLKPSERAAYSSVVRSCEEEMYCQSKPSQNDFNGLRAILQGATERRGAFNDRIVFGDDEDSDMSWPWRDDDAYSEASYLGAKPPLFGDQFDLLLPEFDLACPPRASRKMHHVSRPATLPAKRLRGRHLHCQNVPATAPRQRPVIVAGVQQCCIPKCRSRACMAAWPQRPEREVITVYRGPTVVARCETVQPLAAPVALSPTASIVCLKTIVREQSAPPAFICGPMTRNDAFAGELVALCQQATPASCQIDVTQVVVSPRAYTASLRATARIMRPIHSAGLTSETQRRIRAAAVCQPS